MMLINGKRLKLLVDIGHPAHVHLYRYFISEMEQMGHRVFVTVKDIPAAKELLDIYSIKYMDLGKKRDSIWGKGLHQLRYNLKTFNVVRKEKIDYGIGSSITLAHVSRLTGMKSFIFDDDDNEVEPFFVKFVHPFAHCILSPDCLRFQRNGKRDITYAGYHELAYLHPNRFIPDPGVLRDAGLKAGETFFVMRFNVFKAHHDSGIRGLSLKQKLQLVEMLKKKGKILVTTERDMEPELRRYRVKVSPAGIHSLLYYAAMFIGDSQTMTSEAAVLGTPAIRCNSFVGRITYLEEEEHKYKLTFGFKPGRFEQMVRKIEELLAMPDLKEEWQKRRRQMLRDKIDITAFMVWFIEHYPESLQVVRENPDYQYRFK